MSTLAARRRLGRVGDVVYGVFAVILPSSVALGCIAEEETMFSESEPIETAEDNLYIDNNSTLWTANNNVVPVCWTTTGLDTERRWIREIVESTWMRHSTVKFIGWGACPTSGTAKFVKAEMHADGDGGSASPWGIGALRLPGESATVHFSVPADPAWRSRGRIEYLGVHEFGHVLGFVHEQARPDNPDDREADPEYCRTVGETYGNGTYESGYDRDSIMHYCNEGGNSVGYVSPTDISGVQNRYYKPTASLRTGDGRCLDVQWNSESDWTPVWTWECGSAFGGTEAQLFSYRPSTGNFSKSNSDKVLDVWNASTADGAQVQIFTPNGSVAQRFRMPNTAIKGIGGFCADVQWGSTANKTPLWMWECNGGHAQKFEFYSDGTIHVTDPVYGGNRCLEVRDSVRSDGAIVQINTCNGGSNQQWNVTSGFGRIIAYAGVDGYTGSLSDNYCLDVDVPDVSSFDASLGRRLQIWKCNSRANQRFSLYGEIRGVGDKCMEVAGGARQSGTLIQMRTCNAGPEQKWDYYP